MKKKLLSLIIALGFVGFASAQTVIFEDDFESYENFTYTDVGDWTIYNGNSNSPTYGFSGINFPNAGLNHAFIVFNATELGLEPGDGSDWTAYSGDKAMVSFADVNPPNNSWLISPQITLGEADNLVFFQAKATDAQYGIEQFNVLVSTGTTDVNDFDLIASETITTGTTWMLYNYDLDAYANQDIYIAIQCVSNDQFGFMVDDFKVEGTTTASVDDFTAAQFKIHPNPANDVINLNNGSELIISEVNLIDIQGRVLQTIKKNDLNELQINVSSLSKGMYFLDIATESGKVVKKFSKK